ncbi:DMT family transporter [bacterium]|nr:DMT family transporter [bacterium]
MMDLLNGGGWLRPSLLALFFWGLWGFLTKLSSDRVPWQMLMVLFGICTLLGGLAAGPLKFKFDLWHGVGLAAGLAGALGFLYFYIAISRGQASTVIPLTSLYVAVASVLAFVLLAEPVTLKKLLGIVFAIIAMVLLSG